MRTIGEEETISQLGSLSGQPEANDTTPVMGHNDSLERFLVFTRSLLVLFSHGNDEFSDGLQHTCIRFVEGITPTVVWQVEEDKSRGLHRHCWLFEAIPPHHAAVREPMKEDEQVAFAIALVLVLIRRSVGQVV